MAKSDDLISPMEALLVKELPLSPEIVVEVAFDHVTDNRFRHGTKLLRFRPDKSPRQCKMEHLQAPS